MAILLWLIFTAFGLYVTYLIIKAAINHSDLAHPSSDLQILEGKLMKQNQEMLRQLERIGQALEDQHQLLRERNQTDK